MQFQNFDRHHDIVRLADCILAVADAGLCLSDTTFAGRNENSGNVYVHDEDWHAAIYAPILGNVAWAKDCPDCGFEHVVETYKNAEAIVKCAECGYEL